MTKEVKPAQSSKEIDELGEDIIVVGPGQILSEARKKLSLTPEQVAKRLNFRLSLVTDIEEDTFDHSLPPTFNRGYLRNYAKLVAVDVDEVLAAYDLLGVAEVQRSEMQSFSNLTEKQAEHSRLMWLSYLIAAILFGLMVLWWLQKPAEDTVDVVTDNTNATSQLESSVINTVSNDDKQSTEEVSPDKSNEQVAVTTSTEIPKVATEITTVDETDNVTATPLSEDSLAQVASVPTVASTNIEEQQSVEPVISTAVFTFSGDCWVNIYDATGERIAWGVKKSGYVMTISGKAPLKVTLGKPELAAITFNGEVIDMSPFNVGNIAKFTLPLSVE